MRLSCSGPIPACAGQPLPGQYQQRSQGAYPRVCGATQPTLEVRPGYQGLSPRVRGNLGAVGTQLRHAGPIPACAGQPAKAATRLQLYRAYPRVCGATCVAAACTWLQRGLSPRVRGNLRQGNGWWHIQGPIPACAGQPQPSARHKKSPRAYPRVCGATSSFGMSSLHPKGLSPRVRGNRSRRLVAAPGRGPIPACAGQPRIISFRSCLYWAYPRVCGATAEEAKQFAWPTGLSPRVRGNRAPR